MFARITVIGHQAYIVFPITVIGIRRISDQLIDHCRSFGLRPHGKTSYTYIQRGPVKVGSLIVVQESEIVVGYEIIFFVNALISLKSNQERIVVRRPLLGYPTVVVTAVADGEAKITALSPDGRFDSCSVFVGLAADKYDTEEDLAEELKLPDPYVAVRMNRLN